MINIMLNNARYISHLFSKFGNRDRFLMPKDQSTITEFTFLFVIKHEQSHFFQHVNIKFLLETFPLTN